MAFNSLTFILFFGVVLLLHNLPFPWRVKKFNLVVASCLFYAAWNPPFVLLLIFSAVVDFLLARLMDRTDRQTLRRAILTISMTLNLGLLCFFKYAGFLLNTMGACLATAGIHYHPPTADIVLPLGISFYTFETISYLADVYRRRIRAWDSLLDYGLFLSFFPHLVAGPIVRPADFLPQCRSPRKAIGRELGWGLVLMLIGLFEKVVLADTFLAPVADRVYHQVHLAGFVDSWMGTIAFSGQIFFDFAGYSTCGIGAALCLGFALLDNFRCPYAAIGLSDFWRRWHISLSTWLRDYLYIPLGGNRGGSARTCGNLMLTMLLGGLWHGASWRFVFWGGLHGCYLTAERGLRRLGPLSALARNGVARFGAAMLTFLLVCVTWVFFRAASFHDAVIILRAMGHPHLPASLVFGADCARVLVIVGLMLIGQWFLRESSLERFAERLPSWVLGLGLGFMMITLVLAPGDNHAFIYFQF